jgi:hypothetical protein
MQNFKAGGQAWRVDLGTDRIITKCNILLKNRNSHWKMDEKSARRQKISLNVFSEGKLVLESSLV